MAGQRRTALGPASCLLLSYSPPCPSLFPLRLYFIGCPAGQPRASGREGSGGHSSGRLPPWPGRTLSSSEAPTESHCRLGMLLLTAPAYFCCCKGIRAPEEAAGKHCPDSRPLGHVNKLSEDGWTRWGRSDPFMLEHRPVCWPLPLWRGGRQSLRFQSKCFCRQSQYGDHDRCSSHPPSPDLKRIGLDYIDLDRFLR